MNERLIRTGLLIPAAAADLAAALAVLAPALAPIAAVGFSLVACAAVVLVRRRPHDRRVVLALAAAIACCAVLLAVSVAEQRRHPAAVPTGRSVLVEVRVDSVTATTGNDFGGSLVRRAVVRGVLVAVTTGRGRTPVETPVVLFGGALRPLAPGTVVRARSVLRAAARTDAAAYLGGIEGALRIRSPAPPAQQLAAALRSGFSADAARLPGDGGALLPGLAIGDTSRVGPDLDQAMRDSSLSHLTAVSGANCAVVTVGVLALAGLLRLPRIVRVALAGAALAAFVVLVTPQPSVVRAGTMAAVALACLATGRLASGVPALSVTVLGLLLVDPWFAWSAGFLLSVLATGGLLLLARPLADRFTRVLPRGLALVLAVPIAAQAACTPVLVLLQPEVPVFGVLANLLAEPAAPVATVLGLLACLAGPALPGVAGGIALLAWLPAAWIAGIARVTASLPQVPWPPGAMGALLAAGLLTAALLALVQAGPRSLRAVSAAVVVCTALWIGGASLGASVGRALGTPRDWELAACDVGQGDGLVLHGGGGHYVVVDTGREPGPMAACLDRLGVHRIDLLVLTHWDADHVGGARGVIGRTRTALVGPGVDTADAALRHQVTAAGVDVRQAGRGDEVRVGRLRLRVLWPPRPLGTVEPGNPASIVLHVTGGLTSLLTGDVGAATQAALLRAGPIPAVDVVKVAHHGSADQDAAFYLAARAPIGVLSVGAGNDYGHPAAGVLRMMRAAGTLPVRTDQNGLVLVRRRDGRVEVWSERSVTDAVWTPAK